MAENQTETRKYGLPRFAVQRVVRALPELRADTSAARALVAALAKCGDEAWRMCVPPQNDDSDMLLTRVIDDSEKLAYEVEQLRSIVDMLHPDLLDDMAEAIERRERDLPGYMSEHGGSVPIALWLSGLAERVRGLAPQAECMHLRVRCETAASAGKPRHREICEDCGARRSIRSFHPRSKWSEWTVPAWHQAP